MQRTEFSAATQNAFDFHALGNSSFLPLRKGAKGLGSLCQSTASTCLFYAEQSCHMWFVVPYAGPPVAPPRMYLTRTGVSTRAMPRYSLLQCWESDAGQPSTRCVIIRVAATEL